MSKKRFGRPRLQARPKHHKQAGAVEEALRRRGVTAHVKPSWTGCLIVQVADPDATAGYLDAHATATLAPALRFGASAGVADALFADSVSITSGLRDFIVAPEWRGPDDGDEVKNEDAWPATDDSEPASDESAAAPAAPEGLSAVEALDAFLHGYKMGRLSGVLDDLRHQLVLSGPRADGGFELRLHPGCNSDAIRAQLRSRSAALAEALGADACRIAGSGRQIVITPVSQAAAHQGA
jgi:hypothetical protein